MAAVLMLLLRAALPHIATFFARTVRPSAYFKITLVSTPLTHTVAVYRTVVSHPHTLVSARMVHPTSMWRARHLTVCALAGPLADRVPQLRDRRPPRRTSLVPTPSPQPTTCPPGHAPRAQIRTPQRPVSLSTAGKGRSPPLDNPAALSPPTSRGGSLPHLPSPPRLGGSAPHPNLELPELVVLVAAALAAEQLVRPPQPRPARAARHLGRSSGDGDRDATDRRGQGDRWEIAPTPWRRSCPRAPTRRCSCPTPCRAGRGRTGGG